MYGGARCQVASHALVKIIFLMIIFCLCHKLYCAAAAPLHARGSLHGYLCSSKLYIVALLLFIIFKSSLQNSENLSAHTQSINFPTYDKCIKCQQLLSLIAMFGNSPIHVCLPPHMWMRKNRGSSVKYADSKTQKKKLVLLIFSSSQHLIRNKMGFPCRFLKPKKYSKVKIYPVHHIIFLNVDSTCQRKNQFSGRIFISSLMKLVTFRCRGYFLHNIFSLKILQLKTGLCT